MNLLLAVALILESYVLTRVLRRLQSLERWRDRICFGCDIAADAAYESISEKR